jgi:hypothetical protein
MPEDLTMAVRRCWNGCQSANSAVSSCSRVSRRGDKKGDKRRAIYRRTGVALAGRHKGLIEH